MLLVIDIEEVCLLLVLLVSIPRFGFLDCWLFEVDVIVTKESRQGVLLLLGRLLSGHMSLLRETLLLMLLLCRLWRNHRLLSDLCRSC